MGDVIPLRPARRAIDWRYVREQLSCSRSVAYEHLQRCAAEAGLDRGTAVLMEAESYTSRKEGLKVAPRRLTPK